MRLITSCPDFHVAVDSFRGFLEQPGVLFVPPDAFSRGAICLVLNFPDAVTNRVRMSRDFVHSEVLARLAKFRAYLA